MEIERRYTDVSGRIIGLERLPMGLLRMLDLRAKAQYLALSPEGIGFSGNGRGSFKLNERSQLIERLYEGRKHEERSTREGQGLLAKQREAEPQSLRRSGRFFGLF